MAFVNEYVPEEDVAKYGLIDICRQYRASDVHLSWTVDHERDIYLRRMRSGREEHSAETEFTLFWKGSLIAVLLEISGGGVRGGAGWAHYKLLRLGLPEALAAHREEILADLKEALVAYKDAGVHSVTTTLTVTFEF